ncbi:MAG TPA: YafY family transcriptional regulator [Sedimenticola sp.]|nr:YafY family transcriptional regulator [Sedimenticola sp.]
MDKFDRIYDLHKILSARRRPVSLTDLTAELECSAATAKRIIRQMRDYLGAPITYDRQLNGYHYDHQGEHPYELPGLWFSASELYALLACHQLLIQTDPGLLAEELGPLEQRCQKILEHEHLGGGQLLHRVRILAMGKRQSEQRSFRQAATGLLQRKRLHIRYHARTNNRSSERTISPQRLTHYRDNWYLDAWCHDRDAFRTFTLDRIEQIRLLDQPARDCTEQELDNHFATAYGIFAGQPDNTAVLHFSAERARWVAEEEWHPQQQGRWLEDGRYELRIPYGDPRELVMDILKYGPDVEVTEPPALRQTIIDRLTAALGRYGK